MPVPSILTIERFASHYQHVNTDLIRQVIELLEKEFSNHGFLKQVSLFHEAQ